jgi:hypothetical protein
MNRLDRLAAGVVVVLLAGLGACGTDDGPGTPEGSGPSSSAGATESSPTTAAPTEDPASAADLAGTWRDEEADWTVRFDADGTFSEDFQGVPEFRTGTYTVADGVVTLSGGDGNDDEGRIEDGTLVFKLGTLERQ